MYELFFNQFYYHAMQTSAMGLTYARSYCRLASWLLGFLGFLSVFPFFAVYGEQLQKRQEAAAKDKAAAVLAGDSSTEALLAEVEKDSDSDEEDLWDYDERELKLSGRGTRYRQLSHSLARELENSRVEYGHLSQSLGIAEEEMRTLADLLKKHNLTEEYDQIMMESNAKRQCQESTGIELDDDAAAAHEMKGLA
jgi:hypothetical protein